MLSCDLYFLAGYDEKQVAAAFWNGEMERELRDLGRLDFFGLMKQDEDREKVMSEIDNVRAKSVYNHPTEDCSDACKERGEKNLLATSLLFIESV